MMWFRDRNAFVILMFLFYALSIYVSPPESGVHGSRNPRGTGDALTFCVAKSHPNWRQRFWQSPIFGNHQPRAPRLKGSTAWGIRAPCGGNVAVEHRGRHAQPTCDFGHTNIGICKHPSRPRDHRLLVSAAGRLPGLLAAPLKALLGCARGSSSARTLPAPRTC